MRIGILTWYLNLGGSWDSGIGQHFRLLADTLAEQNHSVLVFLICEESDAHDLRTAHEREMCRWELRLITYRAGVFKFIPLVSWALRDLLTIFLVSLISWRVVRRSFRKNEVDVLETHTYRIPGFFLTLFSPRLAIVQRIATLQKQIVQGYDFRSKALDFGSSLEIWMIERSRFCVTHSVSHADYISHSFLRISKKIKIFPLAVVMPGESGGEFLDRQGSSVNFLYVGRFEYRKGTDILLGAIPQVLTSVPSSCFTLVGADDNHSFDEFFKKLDSSLRGRVRYLGKICPAELDEQYRQCDVFVAPSRYESFGLIYAEAASYGKPSVGFSVGGVVDVVKDGVTGLLVDIDNSVLLIEAMVRLGNDAMLRRELGENARSHYLKNFSPSKLVESSVGYYSDVVATN